jgi:hypothetical protein
MTTATPLVHRDRSDAMNGLARLDNEKGAVLVTVREYEDSGPPPPGQPWGLYWSRMGVAGACPGSTTSGIRALF